MGVSLTLPRMMPGFLPFLIAILAPVITALSVWSTRSLGEVTQPAGLDEARAVLDACPVPLLIVDFKGKIRFANRECSDYGLPVGDNPGPGMSSVLHEHDKPTFQKALEVMRATPFSAEQLHVRVEAGGASIPVVAQMARLKDWNRVVLCFLDPVEAPSPLMGDNPDVQIKMDAICHGIQGPLVGISGVAGALQGAAAEDGQSVWIEQLQTSSNQLLQTVEDLRFLVDLGAKRARLKPVPVRLTDLFDALIAEAIRDHLWATPFVSLIEKGVPDWVSVDGECLKKVLNSMLHYSMLESPYSEIAIGVAVDSYAQGAVNLVFSTFPTGENPAAMIRQGLDREPRRSLEVARQFARWLGGEVIQVLEEDRAGMEFHVGLRQAAPQALSPEEARLRGVQVMLIDHMGTRRRAMLRRLERLGMQFEVVPDGELALSTLRREAKGRSPIELVLLYDDVDEFDGTNLAHSIRSIGPRPPAVLRVAPFGWQEDSEAMTEHATLRDGQGLLREPLNHGEFVDAMDKLLRDWTPVMHVGDSV